MKNSKTYSIVTFGCQMNKSDSERLAAVLDNLGLSFVKDIKKADIIVINACSVRQTAIDRIWGLVNNLSKNVKVTKILTGCLLPEDKNRFKKIFDLVFNIKEMSKLEEFLDHKVSGKDDYLEIIPKYSSKFHAFIPIMTGCDNYCSYCAVPYVRGREVSRPVVSVLAEINKLAENGCCQITLLGQNVNSYQPKDVENFDLQNPFRHNFAKLLWEINQIEKISRLDFTSAHPKDMTDEVIEALAMPKMTNYLHLALQSGDDEILKKMNRQYSVRDYEEIIEKIRKIRPEISIGTDIIVGFPGETKKQFENTVSFYKKIKFDIAYIAMYSPRQGTKAADFNDDVSHEEKKRRWHRLQKLMEKITLNLNKKFVHKDVEVLVDKFEKGFCEGNSEEMKRVRFVSKKDLTGQIINVKVNQAKEWLLLGQVIDKEK